MIQKNVHEILYPDILSPFKSATFDARENVCSSFYTGQLYIPTLPCAFTRSFILYEKQSFSSEKG